MDKINPSTAASLAPAFANWRELEPIRRAKMLEQLVRLHKMSDLSDHVKELINKTMPDALEMQKDKELGALFRFFPQLKNGEQTSIC